MLVSQKLMPWKTLHHEDNTVTMCTRRFIPRQINPKFIAKVLLFVTTSSVFMGFILHGQLEQPEQAERDECVGKIGK